MNHLLKTYAERVVRPLLPRLAPGGTLEGAPGSAFAFIAAALFEAQSQAGDARCLTVVAPSNAEAETFAAEAELFLPADRILYLPGYEGIPYEYSGLSSDIGLTRIQSLSRLQSGERALVFTSADAMVRRLPPPARAKALQIVLKTDAALPQRELMRRLAELGYSREERVESPGEFCLKGAVLDVFPVNLPQPIRVDYFDDEIESLRHFDPETQVGGERVKSVAVFPAGEIALTPAESEQLVSALARPEFPAALARPAWAQEARDEDSAWRALSQFHHPGIEDVFSFAIPSAAPLDAFPEPPLLIAYPATRTLEAVARIEREYATLYREARAERVLAAPDALLTPFPAERAVLVYEWFKPGAVPSDMEPAAAASAEASPESDSAADAEIDPEADGSPRPIMERNPFGVRDAPGFGGRIGEVRKSLVELAEQGALVTITSPYPAQMRRIAGLFRNEETIDLKVLEEKTEPVERSAKAKKNPLFILRSPQRHGFSVPDAGLYVFTDSEIFGRSYRRRSRFKKMGSVPIESFLDLKEGDFVVHVNHGVGRFVALEKVRAAGRERDFLVLEYADADRLYVPLDQISMVQRYVAPTDSPRLDNLGKASFKKIRERVEQRIEEFAQELIRLYAVRMAKRGFSFPPDTAWQEEFEAEFPYEETPDQMFAIEAVKRDMEAPQPMDRLVCGDVGYGKTEVAIRAAFKCVMSGKQCVLIAPTTILAMQHYRNFKERFKNYPISIDWISRFRTRGEVKQVKDAFSAGELDVVIGTHALLAKDVKPKNLGLLVVDEEQRFGVNHKEAIKKMKNLVDVLALSATPIPRTLHMSLVGIRDLSVIATAPHDRLPVQTYVLEDNDVIVREAIARELARHGQVFYLHNRIDTIEQTATRLLEILPEVRVAVLHGQMMEDEIEDILVQFMERRFDVLVTTAIIENGIDMPNVNTLIVDRAEAFGLSQLYQIRGRVGRSNRQAYAYFLYPAGRVLTEVAQKRLNTLLEYQDLGSGFKVAMRDLEIRGSGNILGKEQSGTIMDVGYELYVKLLEDAVHRLKGEHMEAEVRASVNLNTDFFLPESYIPDTRQRIEFYKRFEAAEDEDETLRLKNEMLDRFGPLPPEGAVFVQVEQIRALASLAGFESVYQTDEGKVLLKVSEFFRVEPTHLVLCLKSVPGLSVHPAQPDTLFLQPAGSALDATLEALRRLTEPQRARRAAEREEADAAAMPVKRRIAAGATSRAPDAAPPAGPAASRSRRGR